ncbi:MAG: ABC transporter permease [Calditrichia bacterium]
MPFGTQLAESLRFSLDALTANKVRSLLTTLGIFLGVLAIIVIFTAIQGINDYVEGEFGNLGSGTLYLNKYPWVQTGEWWEFRNRPNITLKDYDLIKDQIQEADWMSPLFEAMRTVAYRNKTLEDVYTVGCNEQHVYIANAEPELGRFFTAMEVYRANPVCVIGQKVREELFGDQDPLGRRIKINGVPHKVIGVLEKKGNFFGFNMDNQVIVPYTSFRTISLHRRGISIAFKVQDPERLDALREEVRGEMRRIRKLAPTEKDNFALNQQDMLTEFYKKITGTSYFVIFVIGAISLVVGGIGIMNIMLVSVTERTKEIGIRKAIGATKNNILMQFLAESVTLSSIGGILGLIAGVLLGESLLSLINLDGRVSLATVIIGYGFSALVGIISGMYPAYKAAGLNPIDALRYE